MSFGFGVGDILAVLKLANKVRKDFLGAPKQAQEVCDEVRNLSIVLIDVDVTISGVLEDLEQILGKFTDISSTNGPSLGNRVKRVWKQLKWEPGDIRELRERLVSVVGLLRAYLDGISSRATLATQKGVDRLNEREDDKTQYATQQHDFINRQQEGTGRWLLDSTEFLLAQIYLHSLGDKTTSKSVRTTLANFKQRNSGSSEESKVVTLRRAYDDAIEGITSQRAGFKDLAFRALSWISCATRPLKTIELQHALAVEIGAPELDHDNIPEVEDIFWAHVLVHYTTQEYLENTRSQWLPVAKDDITRISATYLSFQVFSSGPCWEEWEVQQRTEMNPLYPLVALSFAHHASRASRVWPEVLDFFQLKPNARAAYQFCVYMYDKGYPNPRLATYFGLRDVVDFFLRSGYDLNTGTKEEPGKNSALNHEDSITSSLVAAGKRRSVVDLWFTSTVSNQTPLHVASTWDHTEVARLLLARPGIVVNALDSRESTPLHKAASMGHGEIVELLLSCPHLELNPLNIQGFSPLYLAVLFCKRTVAELLLSAKGIDVNGDSPGNRPPLHGAIKAGPGFFDSGGLEGVKRLLSCSEIDINRKDANGNTPLHCATRLRPAGMANLLVFRPGILVNARNNRSCTPLHLAAKWSGGDMEVMELLLNAPGIDLHAVDDNGDTALSFAVFGGPHLVKRLLRCWTAEASAQWHYSATKASWRAARINQVEVVEILLADDRLGIDLAADVGEDSAISTAAVWNHIDVIRVLLDTGQIPVSEQERALFVAAGRGSAAVVQLLIERGTVSTDITKDTGRTSLEVAKEALNIYKQMRPTSQHWVARSEAMVTLLEPATLSPPRP
ncbi:Ankyrin repeat-containing domain protein [Rhypophila sp. PSN 637]